MMPSITTSSSLYDQYGFNSALILSLLSGQPAIIIFFLIFGNGHPVTMPVAVLSLIDIPAYLSQFV